MLSLWSILFFAGSELAIVVRDIGDKNFCVVLLAAAVAVRKMSVAFIVRIITAMSFEGAASEFKILTIRNWFINNMT